MLPAASFVLDARCSCYSCYGELSYCSCKSRYGTSNGCEVNIIYFWFSSRTC
jgi:hypothetical protein